MVSDVNNPHPYIAVRLPNLEEVQLVDVAFSKVSRTEVHCQVVDTQLDPAC